MRRGSRVKKGFSLTIPLESLTIYSVFYAPAFSKSFLVHACVRLFSQPARRDSHAGIRAARKKHKAFFRQ